MKQLTTYNRAAAYLNTIFDLLNARYFENSLILATENTLSLLCFQIVFSI